MLRIVGIHRAQDVQEEFVLLQNHSSMRVHLRGHVVMAESYIDGQCPNAIHAFKQDELIHSGAYVMLCSGEGQSKWARTKDMALVYFCYLGRSECLWCEQSGPINVLCSQHTYEERPVPFAELVQLLLELSTPQWLLLLFSSALVGFSKSGVPGTGILAVPLLASVFGARLSIGTSIVILIMADVFAVRYYAKDASWDHLKKLFPSVLVGFLFGAILLYLIPKSKSDPLTPVIGFIVLAMLLLSQVKGAKGERFVPTSKFGILVCGSLAGFTTMVSNAAGPIMQIYLSATRIPKEAVLGTTAIYFFCVNLAKIPFYLLLSGVRPEAPMWTLASCFTAICTLPAILLGTAIGRATQNKMPEAVFKRVVLILAGCASIKMLLGF